MATEKEKKYRVSLSASFKKPSHKKLPAGGVIYQRGGLRFYAENGEGKSFHIVTESQLEKLKLVKDRVFDSDPIVKIVDPNLFTEEI